MSRSPKRSCVEAPPAGPSLPTSGVSRCDTTGKRASSTLMWWQLTNGTVELAAAAIHDAGARMGCCS